MRRVAIVCPGRGSYGEATLGSLPADHGWVRAADELRARYELEPLSALDRAERFRPSVHLRPANAAPLIYLVTMIDAAGAMAEDRAVCVLGNSMGWYTALAVASALSFEEGFRLVQEMALLQEEGSPGGQLVYPRVDGSWRPSAELERAIAEGLASAGGEAWPSIELGGYAVLAGSPDGVAHLARTLPKVELGRTSYPFQLARHGPYHTPLAHEVGTRARLKLASLAFRRPRVPLIDGRGVRHTPWAADPEGLREYTLGAQVDTPYDFTTSVRVALREYAPERLVLPGPGNSLGGPCGQVLVREGWRGIGSREDFDRVQASDEPVLVSLRR